MNKKAFTPLENTIVGKQNSLMGLTLLEILISVIILALVVTGLANVFVAAKRYIQHSRSRMTGGELGRVFLDPLQNDVRQDQWGSNCLSGGINCPGVQTIDGKTYTPTYTYTPSSPIANLTKVKVNITWTE